MAAELKEFVAKTTEDVLEGVRTAQSKEHLSHYIAPVTGAAFNYPADSRLLKIRHGSMTFIKFDVAVTAEDADTTKLGGNLKVAVLSLGAGGETATRNTAVTRVQFTVPVLLPAAPHSSPAAGTPSPAVPVASD